jgi:DNA-binding transcriptional LysR family regulator
MFKDGTDAQREYVPVKPVLTVSAAYAAADAALLGLGIAQVGLFDVWEHIRSGHLKILLPRHHVTGSRELTLQYPHRALIAPRVRVTVEHLVDALSRVEALQVEPKSLKKYWAR